MKTVGAVNPEKMAYHREAGERGRDGHDLRDGHEFHHATDLGNACRLVDSCGDALRYVPASGQWLAWDRARWATNDLNQALTAARTVPRLVLAEAERAVSRARSAGDAGDARAWEKRARDLTAWAQRSESHQHVRAALALAEADRRVLVRPGDLDGDPDVLCAANGVVDLRTGELREHRRQDLHTKVTAVEYQPGEAPGFAGFLARILPDRDLRQFVQRAIGYSATGHVSGQCLFLAHGSGANGKTTLLNVVRAVLGDYGAEGAPDLLIAKRHEQHPTELAMLKGCRFVSTVESRPGRRLDDALVKRLTGGDSLTARFMRRDFFTFTPTHSLWLACNHLPRIADHSAAMWRRLRAVPFGVVVPEGERRPDLDSVLVAEEGPAILAWIVAGAGEWYRTGLQPPLEVQLATEAYRQAEDHLGRFLETGCVMSPDAAATSSELADAYAAWCRENGVDERDRVTTRDLAQRLQAEGCRPTKLRRGGKLVRSWRGIGMTEGALL